MKQYVETITNLDSMKELNTFQITYLHDMIQRAVSEWLLTQPLIRRDGVSNTIVRGNDKMEAMSNE